MVSQDILAQAAEIRRQQALGRFNNVNGRLVATAAPAEDKKRKSRFSSLIDTIPDPIRKTGGVAARGFREADKPLSDRLGINAPGPLDFILEELTRPTNLAVALGGAGVAARLGTAGRLGKGAAAVLSPVSKGNTAQRVLGETAIAAAGRGSAEAANKFLPEETPTAVRVAVGLGAGIAGAGASVRAISSASKGALGRDILGIAPQPVRAEARTADKAGRKGNLLKAKEIDEFGETDFTDVKPILNEALDLQKTADYQHNVLRLGADNALNRIGKATKGKDKNWYIKDLDGNDVLLEDVIERPTIYKLSPEQVKGVDDFVEIYKTVRNEAEVFAVKDLKTTNLEEGTNYVHRKPLIEKVKTHLDREGKGAGLSGAGLATGRAYSNPLEGIADGVIYDHPLHAFDEYVGANFKQAVDNHIQSLLVPFSESSTTRVAPGLKAQHDTIVERLLAIKPRLAQLDARARDAIDAYVNSANPDMDTLFDTLKGIKFKTGQFADQSLTDLIAEKRQLQADLNALRPEWRKAQIVANQTPTGRAQVNIGAAPLLAGRDFTEESAKKITDFYTRGIGATTQIGKATAAIRSVQQNIVPVRAMGDMSAMLNQLAAFLPSHPLKFIKNAALALRDMIAPSQYERWVYENGVDGASHGLAVLGRAGDNVEFQFGKGAVGSWMARLPVFKQLQRHFEIITTRNRIDLYNGFVDTAMKAGKPLSDVDKDEIARSLNRLSGIATTRAGDLETLVQFAPNFFRSGIETFVSAAFDGTLEGSLARQYLRNMLVGGQIMAFSVAQMQGRDPKEVLSPFDTNAMKKGELRLNPNFGTVRVAGQDVSLYGRWDSLARIGVISMDSVMRSVAEKDALQVFDAAGYFLSTKGSPLATLAYDQVIRGATFSGAEPFSTEGVVNQLAPFTASAFYQDLMAGSSPWDAGKGAAIGFFGGKARELTALEQLDQAANELYGKDWTNLTGQERQTLEGSLPKLKERADKELERRAAQGDKVSIAQKESRKIDDTRMANEDAAYAALQSGQLDAKQFADAVSNYAYRAAKEKAKVTEVVGAKFANATGAKAALSAWYDTYTKSEIAPDVPDFEAQELLEADLFRRIDAGEFGDPAVAHELIDGRKRAEHSPQVQQFFDAKERISEAGYYDTLDQAYLTFRPMVEMAIGEPAPAFGALLVARNQANMRGDTRLAQRLDAIINKVQARSTQAHKRMRLQNPQLDEDLRATGRVTKSVRFGG